MKQNKIISISLREKIRIDRTIGKTDWINLQHVAT